MILNISFLIYLICFSTTINLSKLFSFLTIPNFNKLIEGKFTSTLEGLSFKSTNSQLSFDIPYGNTDLDLDDDGNKKEKMKDAAKDAKKVDEAEDEDDIDLDALVAKKG